MTDVLPRHKETSRNLMRAARGEDAVVHYLFGRDKVVRKPHCDTDIMNLLADVAHYCDQKKLNFEQAMEAALAQYAKEAVEES